MILYPAIDLKGGKCVRLSKGDFNKEKVYSEDPAAIAISFAEAGAEYIHVVDLDAALLGHGVNEAFVREIVKASGLPVQTGGGIRTLAAIERKLGMGVSRVIIGTKAVENPDFVYSAVKEFGTKRIVVGIDAKEGRVAVNGWEKVSALQAVDLALRMRDCGVNTIVYTDINRDGMLTGPNVEATAKLGRSTGMDIIASGGMSSIDDLLALKEAGVPGAIIGKAIYENKIDLKEALEKTR
ncbi:MAG: 1-(5-phosphoribosyl)-5-[(5-phosphoribosylamino)methylideneamino]imidazole-4-carboxamide isomerase [Lachnospiraceae bacterium]|nr:1-(5-phosphoribosyl)-5-[(5-phosphoribosylamino)methylideneamino]imidazole-4-carboxamide isomerase [Lachnospiraceae bacterium]